MEGEDVDLDGHAFFRATQPGGVRQINVRLGFGLSRTDCFIEVGSSNGRGGRRHRITCPTRESRRMLWEMWSEMERVNWRNRPITAVPKPMATKRTRKLAPKPLEAHDIVECPQCEGNGEDCTLCEGSGEVTAIIAVAWAGEQG